MALFLEKPTTFNVMHLVLRVPVYDRNEFGFGSVNFVLYRTRTTLITISFEVLVSTEIQICFKTRLKILTVRGRE